MKLQEKKYDENRTWGLCLAVTVPMSIQIQKFNGDLDHFYAFPLQVHARDYSILRLVILALQ
jgi:hypothetical protein